MSSPGTAGPRTEEALAGSGIDFPPVDDGLLDRTIGRLIATGYLTAPPVAARALPGLGVARDRPWPVPEASRSRSART